MFSYCFQEKVHSFPNVALIDSPEYLTGAFSRMWEKGQSDIAWQIQCYICIPLYFICSNEVTFTVDLSSNQFMYQDMTSIEVMDQML